MTKKTIWITGGSTGIGRALAIKFANQGWNVAVSARREELLNELSNISNTINKQITQMGSSAALATTNMENSYKAAKAQHKSNKYGIIGSFIGAL